MSQKCAENICGEAEETAGGLTRLTMSCTMASLRVRPFSAASASASRPALPTRLWSTRPTRLHGLQTLLQPAAPCRVVVRAAGGDSQNSGEPPVKYNKEFGYSRKDIILIGAGLIALGYALYYGLQAGGMEPGMAGNWVQLIIFMGICVGWISTYLFRVATKQMTYVKQLEAYEDAVMRKRLEEMTEEEMSDLVREAESDKSSRKKQ